MRYTNPRTNSLTLTWTTRNYANLPGIGRQLQSRPDAVSDHSGHLRRTSRCADGRQGTLRSSCPVCGPQKSRAAAVSDHRSESRVVRHPRRGIYAAVSILPSSRPAHSGDPPSGPRSQPGADPPPPSLPSIVHSHANLNTPSVRRHHPSPWTGGPTLFRTAFPIRLYRRISLQVWIREFSIRRSAPAARRTWISRSSAACAAVSSKPTPRWSSCCCY